MTYFEWMTQHLLIVKINSRRILVKLFGDSVQFHRFVAFGQ
jgi:hypothetical protein